MNTKTDNTGKAQQPIIYDTIIAGAGPVGLFLACELALANCSVLLLEKTAGATSPLKQLPFGVRGLSAPSIEALDRRGLLPELDLHKRMKNPHAGAAKEGPQRQAAHFAGIPILAGDIDSARWTNRLPGATPASLISEMQEMETILGNRAAALGVVIKRGEAITGFQQTASGVIVQCGDTTYAAQWLVGCDGGRSLVRKLGGFEFAGTEPAFTGYNTKVEIADREKLQPGRNVTERGMYLQSQPGYVIMQDFDGGAFHQADQALTLEHIQEVLRRISATDVTLTALHAATMWTDRARQATEYRRGRVLLAGDAAHIHSPLGGQGLNLGLGDAMNLGWKLAATIKGTAPAGLLDTYYEERYPLGMQVLDWSRAQVAVMRPEPAGKALNSLVRDLVATRDGATYFAARIWGINLQYDLGGHAMTGRSVPNFEWADGSRLGDCMHDGKGLLLDFEGNESLKQVAKSYAGQLKYIAGGAKEQLGLKAVLVRPDGIIAWATDGEPDAAELNRACARWMGSRP